MYVVKHGHVQIGGAMMLPVHDSQTLFSPTVFERLCLAVITAGRVFLARFSDDMPVVRITGFRPPRPEPANGNGGPLHKVPMLRDNEAVLLPEMHVTVQVLASTFTRVPHVNQLVRVSIVRDWCWMSSL